MMNSLPKELDFSYFLVHKDIEDYKKYLLGATVDKAAADIAKIIAIIKANFHLSKFLNKRIIVPLKSFIFSTGCPLCMI